MQSAGRLGPRSRRTCSWHARLQHPATQMDSRANFGWLSRNRRLSKDYERTVQTSETLIQVAMIRLLSLVWGAKTNQSPNTTVVIEEEQPGDACSDTDERPPGEHVGKRTRPDAGEKTRACKAGGHRRAVALPPRSVGPSPDRQPPRAFELVQRPGGGVELGGVLLFFFLECIGKRQLCLALGAQHGEKGVREH